MTHERDFISYLSDYGYSSIDLEYLLLNGYTAIDLMNMTAEEVEKLSDLLGECDMKLLGC